MLKESERIKTEFLNRIKVETELTEFSDFAKNYEEIDKNREK